MKYTRRDFIKLGAGAGAVVGLAQFGAPVLARLAAAQAAPLLTLTDWLNADRATRKRGIEFCLTRIRQLEPSIHAWVQVQPERSSNEGPLAGIPYGVKDIVETKGVADRKSTRLNSCHRT